MVDKPKYTHTNSGEIVRERSVDEMRFNVSEQTFDVLIEHLVTLKGVDEEDLV